MRIIYFILLMLLADIGMAESINVDFSNIPEGSFTSRIIQIIGLTTILSIAPAIVMMVTSFTRIIIVFSIVRTALGLQQTPPNMVLSSLALFMTFFIMSPHFTKSYNEGILPLVNEQIDEMAAFEKISMPFHEFMIQNTRAKELEMFLELGKIEAKENESVPFHALIPAFMLSEMKRAFEMGFLLFLPFVIIDLFISSVLMAMGMMMLPPVMLSLPFKLIFFVLVDGWSILCSGLIKSYGI